MPLTIIGAAPLAKDSNGSLASRIATIFPCTNVIVTVPGMHATQRLTYAKLLNRQRAESGQAPLTDAEAAQEWKNSVDLIMEDDLILIRPDPENMEIAFRADELLQELVSKQRIQFLNALNEKVRYAIKRRGECWRINPLPRSPDEMKRMIAASRIGIGGKEIYYYNKTTGTRFLTYQEFAQLRQMDEASLRQYLAEIRSFSALQNRFGNPQIDFFMAAKSFSAADFAPHEFLALAPAHGPGGPGTDELRQLYEALARTFQDATPPQFQQDDLNNFDWRNQMFAALIGKPGETLHEETLLGLSSEFFMQIEWLAGGRIEEGELLFDPIFDEKSRRPHDESLSRICDEKARGFIFNFIREYGDLEYVNVGRVVGSLSTRPALRGRRGVYIAEIKPQETRNEIVKIIRMQKWGVHEHLEAGRSLLDAMIQSEEYAEYILDRRLGCRQLGMNLPTRIGARRISERYYGRRKELHGITIWTPYFDRDYVHGVATDKMANYRFQKEAFALRFAQLVGEAAAPNMIVGRLDLQGTVIFDDGDEVVVLGENGMPAEIVVTDPTGCFNDYRTDLRSFAAAYAAPVNRRAPHVPKAREFSRVYTGAFAERFAQIQREYRKRQRAFDTLFKHQRWDEAGSFAYRWEQVLARLNRTDPAEIAELIRKNIRF